MQGRTPSPCVLCNTHLKFDRLLTLAQQINADKVATGHYAQVERGPDGRYLLKKGVDLSKDQSYFLFELKQWQLSKTLFPLGHMRKEEIRTMARARALPVAEKPDSQEICFVSGKNYSDFIEEAYDDIIQVDTNNGFTPGEIVTRDQKVLGRHAGIFRYTVGQRRGLGISVGEPLYVIEINPTANQVVVGPDKDLHHTRLIAERVNWILFDAPAGSVEVQAKIRSRHEEALAMVYPIDETSVRIEFAEPQRAITPGQAIVFYQKDVVIGGGWIREIEV
jgi:tRNA-specific 2-thiouridylase